MSAHESAILKEDVLTIKHDTVDAFSTVSKTTQPRFKFSTDLPPFVSVNEVIPIQVILVDEQDQILTGMPTSFQVSLVENKKDHPPAQADTLLYFDELADEKTTPMNTDQLFHIQDNGKCDEFKIALSQCSNHTAFQLCVVQNLVTEESVVEPLFSTPVLVIESKLVIHADLPDLWYKDEGGRDKCMTLQIHLVDAKGQLLTGQQLKLQVSLEYESGHTVTHQDILKLTPESQMWIDASTGMSNIKFRIEDVSKNHQGQAFRIRIKAKDDEDSKTSHALSSCISVRSKRNKRVRSSTSRALPNSSSSNGQHHFQQQSSSSSCASSSHETATITGPGLEHSNPAAAGGTTFTLEMPHSSSSSSGANKSQGHAYPTGTVHGALTGVIEWAGNVVNGLNVMEWQVIGYESKADGSKDPSRPLYRCPSCWRYKDVMSYHTAEHESNCVIANILMSYATSTMGHLNTLIKSVEEISAFEMEHQRQEQQTSASHHHHPSPPLGTQSGVHSSHSNNNHVKRYHGAPAAFDTGGNPHQHPGPSNSNTLNNNHNLKTELDLSPPTLARGLSDFIGSLDVPTLNRGVTIGLNDILQSISQEGVVLPKQQRAHELAEEQRVHYILAKVYTAQVSGLVLGFPAFDQHQELVGFYQEGQDALASTTAVIFLSLADVRLNLTSQDVAQIRDVLVSEEAKASSHSDASSIFHLDSTTDLLKMKEDALMYHWGQASSPTSLTAAGQHHVYHP